MATITETLEGLLRPGLPRSAVQSILRTLPTAAQRPVGALDTIDLRDLVTQIDTGQRTFHATKLLTADELRRAITGGRDPLPHREAIRVRSDNDVVLVQRRCQALTRGFFGPTDCVRLATATSELARNLYMYAGDGELTVAILEEPAAVLFEVIAEDNGPGIPNLELILSGKYVSRTGLGRGLAGTRALLDTFEVETKPGHTVIRGSKRARRR